MKKILYITYYWPPSGGAGVQRSLKFVKYLSEFQVQATVLTVDEKQASYPLLDDTLLAEIPSGIEIHKTDSFEPLQILSKVGSKKSIPYGGFANPGKEKFSQKVLRFIRGNFFIPDARKGWVKYAVKAAGRIIKEQKIVTVIISSPPHSSQLIGLALKKQFPNLHWIADMRDPWTDIYYYNEMLHTALAKEKDQNLEKAVLEKCSAAIVVSNDLKRLFLQKSKSIDPNKIFVIPNGYDSVDFKTGVEPCKDKFLITYVGTIADSYNPEIFFSTFKNVLKNHPNVSMKIRFVGSISSQVTQFIESYDLKEKVEIIGHVSHEQAICYMQESSILLLVIPHVKNDKGILTGKLFEYIGARRPVLGIGPSNGDAAQILAECNAGKMFDREQEKEVEMWLMDAVNRWQQNHSFRDGNAEAENYSRKELTRKLAEVLSNIP
ncbi:MAG: glycosyltransferase family 4 protein [Bacteroidetes bacterium]|nr:glycosyltransferase family 4 protein [Bacteroidota bacterium]MBP6649560.1 glycosyltransferase family 4 protein [Bacteroidia bacterium]